MEKKELLACVQGGNGSGWPWEQCVQEDRRQEKMPGQQGASSVSGEDRSNGC